MSMDDRTNRYLWVIDTRGVPYTLDAPISAIGAVPKHTNLTGGGQAYLGGELWFVSGTAVYISGGSGRYPPIDAAQLDEAAQVFRAFGYDVTSLGWDSQRGQARRILVGN